MNPLYRELFGIEPVRRNRTPTKRERNRERARLEVNALLDEVKDVIRPDVGGPHNNDR